MKILFIAPFFSPVTGQSLAAGALLSEMVVDNYSVVAINMGKNTFRHGIDSFGRVVDILWLIWNVWRAGRDFDLVYLTTSQSLAGNLKDLLLLAVIGRRMRSKTWLHLHGGVAMRGLLSNRTGWIGRLNAFFLSRVAGVIVLGERLVSVFDGYVNPERIRIVRNFAPDEVFLGVDRIAEKWSETSTLRVLFLSNLLPGKGYRDLLDAIKRMPPEMAGRFSFDFAGGFETKADEAQFLEDISGLPAVRYHGIVHGEVKQGLLARSHVFCLPSYYEGQPISILEAYASGCVVLTTDRGGIFDIFSPGKNGWEVVPQDPASILAALMEVAASPEQSATVAQTNRREADQQYTKRQHLRNIYSVLGLKGIA